jgi:hypothetical protein
MEIFEESYSKTKHFRETKFREISQKFTHFSISPLAKNRWMELATLDLILGTISLKSFLSLEF